MMLISKATISREMLLGKASSGARVYSFNETVVLLDTNEHKLRQLLVTGLLKGYRLGIDKRARWYIPETAIADFILQQIG